MSDSAPYLTVSQAARRLGVSPKALRIYEEHGLLMPVRSEAGWRLYGAEAMGRATDVVALRALGLSLTRIAGVLDNRAEGLEEALADHQVRLEVEARRISDQVEQVRQMRNRLAEGAEPGTVGLTRLLPYSHAPAIAFELPWPWDGERFELPVVSQLTYIIGPLFSGKTRLAQELAKAIPGARFLSLERLESPGATPDEQAQGRAFQDRVDHILTWLVEDGATVSDALVNLLGAMIAERSTALVIDMIEQDLDAATQAALATYLRHREAGTGPVIMTTRSDAILDLDAVGTSETILFCPANHAPPFVVAPHPGAPGYEAVATCLASPDVRARTAGVVAVRMTAA
ncbi:MAG: MerR family transcriptional regulator [Pseudomonadota bacterium]